MEILKTIQSLKPHFNQSSNFSEALQTANTFYGETKPDWLKHLNCIKINEVGTRIQFKYIPKIMYKTPWDNFYNECRGIVLDWKTNELVLYPFDKFHELNEHKTTSIAKVKKSVINSERVEFTEKIDGSLIFARWFHDELVVASSESMDGFHGQIAKDLIEKNANLLRFIQDHPLYTIIFEMTNQEFRNIVKYKKNELIIIGMRNMETLTLLWNEEMQKIARPYEVRVVSCIPQSFDSLVESLQDPTHYQTEGFVLRTDTLMVKLKYQNYILAHRFGGDPSRNFNIMMDVFNEGRYEAIQPLIHDRHKETFLAMGTLFEQYIQEKEKILFELYQSIPESLSFNPFLAFAKEHIDEKYLEYLVEIKKNIYQKISKLDRQKLRHFANFFITLPHPILAEKIGISVEELEEKIEKKEVKTLHSYKNQDNKIVFILPYWQFVNLSVDVSF